MSSPVYKFGDFRLDCGAFELLRNSHSVRIERKPMELLILLASRQGQLVTRDEIAQHLWPPEVFVDVEHGINTAIRKLRYVLRDDPEAPHILQTVKGKGYRIICPIETSNGHQSIEAASALSTSSPEPVLTETVPLPPSPPAKIAARSKQMNYLWLIPFVLALVALFTASWYRFTPPPALRVTEFKPITRDGHAKSIVGSDESRIYFNWETDANRIGEVAVGGGESATVRTSLPGATLFDVSTNGSALLVRSDDRGHQSLWNVQVPGGSMQRLADASVWSAAWSPDSKSLVYSTSDDDIFLANHDGTGIHRIYAAEDHKSKTPTDDIAWSPDGSKIRFARDSGLWEVNGKGEGLHELLPGWRSGNMKCCGRWTPDGRFFIFLVKDALSNPLLPGEQLWALDEHRAPHHPVQLAASPIRWATPVPSKDSKKIFARGIILRGELVRYDPKVRQLQPWLGGISAEFVTYSRTGDFMAYVTFPGGVLWRANRDGSNPVQLTSSPFYPLHPHVSPDGSRILFFGYDSTGKVKSFVVPSTGGVPQLLVPEDKEEQVDPTWSPDGNKVAYGWPKWERSNTNSVIHVLDLKTRAVLTLPGSKGMWSPNWSPNGRYLACLNSSGGIAVYDFQTQRWWEVQKGERDYPTWSADSRFLYFAWTLDGPPGVYRVPVFGGSPECVVDLTGFRFTGGVGFWFDLDPTGAPLLLRDTGSDDIYALTLEEK